MATIFYDGQLREIEQYPLTLKQTTGDIVVIVSPNRLLHIVRLSDSPRISVYGSTAVFDQSDGLTSVSSSDAICFILTEFNKSMEMWTDAMNSAAAKPRKPENIIMTPTSDTLREHFKQSLPVVGSGALGFGKDLDDAN